MSDLTDKLHWMADEYTGTDAGKTDDNGDHQDTSTALREAADRIQALEAALKPFANLGAALPEHYPQHDDRQLGPGHPRFWYEIDPAHIWAARKAIYGLD